MYVVQTGIKLKERGEKMPKTALSKGQVRENLIAKILKIRIEAIKLKKELVEINDKLVKKELLQLDLDSRTAIDKLKLQLEAVDPVYSEQRSTYVRLDSQIASMTSATNFIEALVLNNYENLSQQIIELADESLDSLIKELGWLPE